MDGHYKVLQWLIDNNKTNVELTYNTNLSTLTYKNHNIFDLWSRFQKVSLWPSIDGYKEHCEYGRTNLKWSTFESNLEKVKNYVDTITCTTSIYSILTTPELIVYLKNLGLSTHLSILSYPFYLDMRLLPDKIKDKYKTAFHQDQIKLIECAAARQKWIDQGQSLNLYNNKTSLKFLNDMYMHAWKSGLKTTYYLRSTAASTIEKSTVSNQKKEYSKEEAAACSIEAMRNGEECEACQ